MLWGIAMAFLVVALVLLVIASSGPPICWSKPTAPPRPGDRPTGSPDEDPEWHGPKPTALRTAEHASRTLAASHGLRTPDDRQEKCKRQRCKTHRVCCCPTHPDGLPWDALNGPAWHDHNVEAHGHDGRHAGRW